MEKRLFISYFSKKVLVLIISISLVIFGFSSHILTIIGQTIDKTITVCSSGCNYTTVQPAINAAVAGDTVLVSPGTYTGGISIAKAIILASHFHTTGDANMVNTTTITGGSPIIDIPIAGGGAKIIGFTFTGGTKGVVANAEGVEVTDNRFIKVGSDSISWEKVGGTIRRNYVEGSSDDCIDLDGPRTGYIESNTCMSPGDDGLEARLHNYTGAMRHVYINGNTFYGADEDGIQLIDYDLPSDYTFHIERNILANNAFVGLGIMDGSNTIEDYRGANIPERVHVFNNTITRNNYGITGGDNLAAINNIILNNTTMGMKNVDAGSAASYNLFWGNGADYSSSNIDTSNTVFADPLLDGNYFLQAGSPAIDAGTASFTFKNESVLQLQPGEYAGNAPDIGKNEYGLTATPTPTPTSVIAIPTPTPTIAGGTTISRQIAVGSDDAEQSETGGSVSTNSSDLEFTMDGTTKQTVGMRFTGLPIPQGAIITNAFIEFTADEQQPDITDLAFYAQASDNPLTFTTAAANIGSRPKTLNSINWDDMDMWTVDRKYATPNLAPVVQEVVSRPGWASGNAMVFISTGTGHRTADAYEGGSAKAAKLVVSYTTDPNVPSPTPIPSSAPTSTPILTPTATPTPSPTPGGTSVFTFLPVADAHVLSTTATTNYGSFTQLLVDGKPITTTYVRFDLSPIAGKTITSAVLRIRITNTSASMQNVKDVINNTWSESGITYNTRPALGTAITTINGGQSGTFKSIPLTAYVAGKAGQLFSLGIDSTGNDGFDFYSKERATITERPTLIIEAN